MFFSPYNFPRDLIQMKLFLNMGDGEIWTKRGIADFVGANKMILEYIFSRTSHTNTAAVNMKNVDIRAGSEDTLKSSFRNIGCYM